MTAHAASHVFFGLNPMWVSTCILAITYATIMSEKVNRAIVALVGAGVMILVGVLDQEEAIHGIDLNTIGLLTGMMILVSISRRSGMFQYLAVWSAQAAKAHPAGILFILQITTAVLSAFLDNVTTVLLIVPVTLAICETLKVPAYPYLFAEIFASNIGGTATLIGDPPNILIGSQVGLTFNDFVYHLTPVILIVMAVQAVIIHVLWGKDLKASHDAEARVMAMNAAEFDRGLAAAQAVAGRAHPGHGHLRAGAAAASRARHHRAYRRRHADAARQLVASRREGRAQHPPTFGDVEWITIFFFIGLFVVVHGVDVGGLLDCSPASWWRRPAATVAPPATRSCGPRPCCRRSSTTSPSSPP